MLTELELAVCKASKTPVFYSMGDDPLRVVRWQLSTLGDYVLVKLAFNGSYLWLSDRSLETREQS